MCLKGTWVHLFKFSPRSKAVCVFSFSYILPCLWKLLTDTSDHLIQSLRRIALGKPSREWLTFHLIMWMTWFCHLSFLDVFPKEMTIFNTRKLFRFEEAKVTSLVRRNFTLCSPFLLQRYCPWKDIVGLLWRAANLFKSSKFLSPMEVVT